MRSRGGSLVSSDYGVDASPGRALHGPVLIAGLDDATMFGALRFSELLARRDRLNAHVLGVIRPADSPVLKHLGIDAEALDAGRRVKHLEALRSRMAQTVGLSGFFSVEVVSGTPDLELATAARDRESACVVVGLPVFGSRERQAVEDEILQIARSTDVPVIAVPETVTTLPKHALVAMDFSESSRRAARLAACIAAPGAAITVVHVEAEVDLTALRDNGPTGLATLYSRGAGELYQDLADELGANGNTSIELVLLKGDVAPRLLEYARRRRCDLIACGSQGAWEKDRHFTGSVSTALLRGAHCGVLIASPATPPA